MKGIKVMRWLEGSDFQQNGNFSVQDGAPKSHEILHRTWIDTPIDREIDRTTEMFLVTLISISTIVSEGYRHTR